MKEFTKKFEKEFSSITCPTCNVFLGCRDTLPWFLDSGGFQNMMEMRYIFLNFTEIELGSYVGCGDRKRNILAMEGVGSVKFQLE